MRIFQITQKDLKTSLLLLFFTLVLIAQQQPQSTQYLQNPALYNAAYIGTLEGLNLTGSYRSQWTGIDNAPSMISFVGEQQLNPKIGLGFSVLNDDFGPTANTDLSAHFSYKIRLRSNLDLRFSLSAIGSFFTLNTSELNIANPTEGVLGNSDNSFTPNLGIGTLISADKWFFGLSSPALFNTEDDEIAEGFRTQAALVNIMGGYHFELSRNWGIKPTFLVQQYNNSPTVFNLTANVLFQERISVGANYRNDETLGAILGFWITNNIGVYYSYDYAMGALGAVSNGSHEFLLCFQLNRNGRSVSIGRN
ncbi:MAG: type IX secretion system membrane protein PorP/SprF [Bacteroidota bacterium]